MLSTASTWVCSPETATLFSMDAEIPSPLDGQLVSVLVAALAFCKVKAGTKESIGVGEMGWYR